MSSIAPSPRVQRLRQRIGNIAYASGQSPSVNVPQSDYTLSFDIISSLTITVGVSAPVVAGYGAFGPLGQVTVRLQGGTRRPYSLSGFQADVYSRVRNNPYTSQLTASPIATSTANAWTDHVHVPLTISEDTERGCWFTGDTQLQMSVVIQCAPATQVFSTVNGATIAGSWDVWREVISAPPPDQPGGLLREICYYHEITSQGTFALRNGTAPGIDLPRDVDYERIFLFFYSGNNSDGTFAPADGLYTTIDSKINDKIHIWDSVTEAELRFEQLWTNGTVLPAGTATLDNVRLKSDVGMSLRDIIPTDSNKVSHWQLLISSTGSYNVDVITETVADNPFAARWVKQAAANAGQKAS